MRVALFSPALVLAAALTLIAALAPVRAEAQVTAFRQAVAETAARNDALAAFYRARDFQGIWTGPENMDRRNAFLTVLAEAADHGLPAQKYDPARVIAMLHAARTPFEQGQAEVALSLLFLDYARDIQTGMLTPSRIIPQIKREVPLRDPLETLVAFSGASPSAFLRALPPASPEYARLMRVKLDMERRLGQGGWGPAVPTTLEPGDSGPAVVALRNRLISMGFLPRTASQTYDAAMTAAVTAFQEAHGLEPDGVVGAGTLDEINVPMEQRLRSVIVAMERERWLNMERGERHIWVNMTDFSAAIVDNGVVTFRTRSVIGHVEDERQSYEFSDVMEYMVINPSWYVPRSIIMREYLPLLKANPYAVSHLEITDSRGRVINRGAVNFSRYTERTFPYAMRQPPSRSNALGLVKFMFPNPYAIYLHDTPAKSLFGREVRAFSHGCIRLNDPFDFAYVLLARQESDPEAFFQALVASERETRVNLEVPVPVHLVYRTAFTRVDGRVEFRRDVYDRDARIWQALVAEGVAIRGASS